jgi:hypothetical protein
MTDFICLNHSGTAASQVLVEIIQTGAAQADPFKLKAASGDNGVGLTIRIDNPVHGGGSFSQQGQTAQALELSQPGCTAGTSSSSIAHKLIITPSAISAGAATETGTLSATFTIRIASPS